MNAFSNDNGIEYDDNEIQDNDDAIEDNDSAHEENETQREGARFLKRKHGSTIDHTTAEATPVDTDLLPAVQLDESDEGTEPELPRAVDPKIAKQQMREKLAAETAIFGKLAKLPKKGIIAIKHGPAANDNFKQKESWPVIDQLTRPSFEPDKERREKLIATVRHIRELVDMAGTDSLGLSIHRPGKAPTIDFESQRTDSGKVHYEHGQSLDRKKRTYEGKNGEIDAERHDGPVRTSKGSQLISNSGFDVHRDDPFPARMIAAHDELDEIIAAVGPLWVHLLACVCASATLTDIGSAVGAKHTQAPGAGTAIIRIALTAAIEAIDRFNEDSGETYLERLQKLPNSTPVPARRLKRALLGNDTAAPSLAPMEQNGPKTPATRHEMQAAKAIAA
jgi:hypothetical protein